MLGAGNGAPYSGCIGNVDDIFERGICDCRCVPLSGDGDGVMFLTLADLPPPPPGRTGWPWTVGSRPLPARMRDGRPWPRISIVTPSFNQGAFIEETIRSVLLQGYPDLDYQVLDGGSRDGTIEILRRYAPWLSRWRSAPDGGQAAAIGEGLTAASGAIFQFINSDDFFCPDSFAAVAEAFVGADVVGGGVIQFSSREETLYRNRRLSCGHLLRHHGLTALSDYHQPGVFLDTAKLRSVGGFEPGYRYVFDFVTMVRYLDRFPRVRTLGQALAHFRLHETTKSVSEGDGFGAEFERARRDFAAGGLGRRHRALAGRIVRRQDWAAEVTQLRASTPSRARFVVELARRALLDPRVGLNRFTFGAMRRALSPVGAG